MELNISVGLESDPSSELLDSIPTAEVSLADEYDDGREEAYLDGDPFVDAADQARAVASARAAAKPAGEATRFKKPRAAALCPWKA